MRAKIWAWVKSAAIISLLAGSISSCNFPDGPRPTEMSVTQAYETVAALLTSTAGQPAPSETLPAPTETAPPSPSSPPDSTSPAITFTPTTPPLTRTPTPGCDQASAGTPIDVTIPDDTVLGPGQAFTKIWRLENTGTCTWSNQYAVTFFSGDQMGAPAVVNLSGEVAPGQSVDITVDMVSPTQPGGYQGNWKLRNSTNVLFGIGPNNSAPFWVRIVVAQTATTTPTAATATLTPTPTPTQPAVKASGNVALRPLDQVDLDTAGINPAGGSDLLYTTNTDGQHLLSPLAGVGLSQWGATQPSLANCQAATLSADPLAAELVSAGVYFCIRSNMGLPGWIRIAAFNLDDYTLTLDLLTWTIP